MKFSNPKWTAIIPVYFTIFSLFLGACGGISSNRSSIKRTPGEPKESLFLTMIIKDAEAVNQIRVTQNNGESEFLWTEKKLTKKQDVSLSSAVSEPRIWCNILSASGFPFTKDQTFTQIIWGKPNLSNSRDQNSFPYIVFTNSGPSRVELRCFYKGEAPDQQEMVIFLSPIIEIRSPTKKQ